MKRPSLRERLRYAFDNSMARGPIAVIGWLAVVSACVVLTIALIVWAFGLVPADAGTPDGSPAGFLDIFWLGLMRTLDSGTMGGDTGGWPFLLMMLAVTLGGIFVISTLIGVLTSGIESKVDELRKGRSAVLETDHTLILGWSPQIFDIVSELVVANENRRKPRIVILAPRDKVEMEDDVRTKVAETKNTRIICRTGDPLDLADLEIASPHTARSIVILESASEHADAYVIKAILALTNNPHRKAAPYNIVAEIHDAKDLAAARLVGGDEARLIVTGELISRIIVQTSRQSGLSLVYTDLLDFAGDEVYFQEEPRLAGRTFGEALLAYEESAVIGLRTTEGVRINPPMETVIMGGDKIIAVSADDDTVLLAPHAGGDGPLGDRIGIDRSVLRSPRPVVPAPEHTLLLGWNRRAAAIVTAFDAYVASGSTVRIVATDPPALEVVAALEERMARTTIQVTRADTTDRAVLDAIDFAAYDQVIALPYSDWLGVQEADARTLITLLHIRDITARRGQDVQLVTEMLDVRNRELAEVTQVDDFIVSSRLTSLMLAQVSENPELAEVFADLLDPEGSEIYLKPANDYVAPGVAVTFYTVVEAARLRGKVAMGYRIAALGSNASANYGVRLNPKKSDPVTFVTGDSIVVLAEDMVSVVGDSDLVTASFATLPGD